MERLGELVLGAHFFDRPVATRPAFTISKFCCVVRVWYLLVSLNVVSSSSGPSWVAPRTGDEEGH